MSGNFDKEKALRMFAEQQALNSEPVKRQRYGAQGNRQYGRYKTQARRSGVSFDLEFEEFRAIASKPCAYCGKVSERDPAYGTRDLACGVTRIDIYEGFRPDNLAPTCTACAKIKRVIHSNYGHSYSPEKLEAMVNSAVLLAKVRRRAATGPTDPADPSPQS